MSQRWYVLPAVGAMAVIAAFFIWGGLAENTVFYLFPDEAVARRTEFADGERFRLGGRVVPGTVRQTDSELEFQIGDGAAFVDVVTTEAPPQLFREDIAVLVEGFWEGDRFRSDQIIIRHDENYDAPDGYEERAGG